ncbi:hypothetical protein CRG98_046506 [Punica granatum]|uniref:Uncharacterized protein n=1 Tax=Punica granatum TaxID=22663 RepID=A0A2I0HN08_PUNGR|nr:hypothetical protein CRG98_046506 [Punica granatum]
MSPDGGSLPSAVKQRFGHLLPGGPRSALAVSGLLLLFYVSSFNYRYSQDSSDLHRSVALNWRALWPLSCSPMASAPTNLSHIVFGIVGSLNTWKGRKAYLESWWRPNVSRGYLFLDGPPENESLLCPFTCPALRINENITHWDIYPKIKYPIQIRMVRSIIDLRGNIAGLLSSHPQSPFLSLHHINIVDPIFPSMNRSESISHLMKSARVDQSRLAQQTICYQREMNWSVSVSWGYSAHIYESILPRYILRKPIETFSPWKEKAKWPMFMFNTRPGNSTNPCEVPHWFFFESIERQNEDDIVTTYSRAAKHGLGPCSLGGSHSADHINRLQVFSPAKTRLEVN